MAYGAGNSVEDDIFASGGAPEPDTGGQDNSPSVPASAPEPEHVAEARAVSQAIRDLATGPRHQPRSDVSAPQPGSQPQGQPQPQETSEQVIARLQAENQNLTRERDGILGDLRRTRGTQQPQPQGQPQQGQQGPALADQLFSDPEGALDRVFQTFGQQIAQVRLEADLDRAADRHPEEFPQAFQAFMSQVGNPEQPDPNTYFRIMNARSPGREIMTWYKEQDTLKKFSDPDAFRQSAIAEHMANLGLNPDGTPLQQAPQGRPAPQQDTGPARGPDGKFAPRHETRIPSSTSRMSGSQATGADMVEDGSEAAIFDSGRRR